MNYINNLIKDLGKINKIKFVENIIDNNNFYLNGALEVYTEINNNNKYVFDKIFKINQERGENLISFDSLYFMNNLNIIFKYNFSIEKIKKNKNDKNFIKFLDYDFLFYRLNLNNILKTYDNNCERIIKNDEFIDLYSNYLLNKNKKGILNIETLYKNIKDDLIKTNFNQLKYTNIYLEIIEKSTLKVLEKENIFDYNNPNNIAIYIENIIYYCNNNKMDTDFLKNFYETMFNFYSKIQRNVILNEVEENYSENNVKNKRKM